VDGDQEQSIKDAGAKARMTSQITLMVNMVLSTFLGKALDKIWLSLNACQIIYLMPLMSVPYPKFLKMYLKILEFANLDVSIGGDPWFYRFLRLEEIIDKPVSTYFEDYGYESSIFFFSYADKL
jgi:hypothetical protein